MSVTKSAEGQDALPPSYSYPEDQTYRLDARQLGVALARVTFEVAGQDEIFLDNYRDEYPKLLSYLIGSKTVHYTCEKEKLELREWTLAQADNSVDPIEIYAKALTLCQADVFRALLTVHDLLRNEFRFQEPYLTGYPSTPEKMSVFQNKLIDIRGDLRERGTGFTGDHGGSWYRIYGMLLYMVAESVTDSGRVEKDLTDARLLGLLGAFGSEAVKPLTGHIDPDSPRKFSYNALASVAGVTFLRALRDPAILTRPVYQNLTGSAADYLVSKPEMTIEDLEF